MKEWTQKQIEGPKGNVYKLCKHLGWNLPSFGSVKSASGGFRVKFRKSNKEDAQKVVAEMEKAAQELGIRACKGKTNVYDPGYNSSWSESYTFLYESKKPEDIEKWNALMDEYQMPVARNDNNEPTDKDPRYWYKDSFKGLGIKFLANGAGCNPHLRERFEAFLEKAATLNYWAEIVIEAQW